MWLSFAALDVWFFRDGRPFDAGDAHFARSQFPPPPETMLGAVRALLLEDRFQPPRADGLSLDGYLDWMRRLPTKLPGDDDPPLTGDQPYLDAFAELGAGTTPGSKLALAGPFVVIGERGAANETAVVPAPRDLLEQKGAADLLPLAPLAGDINDRAHPLFGVAWNDGLPLPGATGMSPVPVTLPLITRAADVDELKGVGWITVEGLTSYLMGGPRVLKALSPFGSERRAGIALGQDRLARDGHFYQIEMIRPQTKDGRARLLMRVAPDPAPGPAWHLSLGGEAKTARATVADADPAAAALMTLLDPASRNMVTARTKAAQTGWLRVVLLQPAIFRRGWLPDGVAANGVLTVESHTFFLRAAAVNKTQPISGWDLRTGRPKPLRHAVPAGAVYYFQIEGSDETARGLAAEAFWEAHHGKAALQDDPAAGRAGYGLAVAGACAPGEVPIP